MLLVQPRLIDRLAVVAVKYIARFSRGQSLQNLDRTLRQGDIPRLGVIGERCQNFQIAESRASYRCQVNFWPFERGASPTRRPVSSMSTPMSCRSADAAPRYNFSISWLRTNSRPCSPLSRRMRETDQ